MALVVGVGCAHKHSLDPDDALNNLRFTQARWVDLDYAPCTLNDDDLFPVAQCDGDDPETSQRKLGALSALESSLPSDPDAALTVTQLRLHARVEALPDAQGLMRLRRAETSLLDALRRAEGDDEADAASDLAALRLMLAERLQSAVMVVDALDASARALEVAPDHPEARFNHDLALLWLGVWREMPGPDDDPWRAEQRAAGVRPEPSDEDDDPCWTRAKLRTEISSWSTGDAVDSVPPWWSEQRACWQGTGDRLFGDVLDDLQADPTDFARQWRQVDAAKAALRAFDLEAAVVHLQELQRAASHPLRLAGVGFEVQEAYFRSDTEAVDALVTRQLAESRDRSYLEMVARNLLQQALTRQVEGDWGAAAFLLDEALALAERADADTLLPAIWALRVETWEQVGREEAAWLEVVQALRSLDEAYSPRRLGVLQTASRLADRRGAQHARWALLNLAWAEAKQLGAVQEAGVLKDRGEAAADRGDLASARQDLDRGQSILREAIAQGTVSEAVAQQVLDDLGLLEGRVAETAEERVASLDRTVAAHREDDYSYYLVRAQRRLASARLEAGERFVAKEDLRQAFDELSRQARSFADSADAAAILAAGRTVAGDLMSLQLQDGEPDDALQTLGTYLGLRQEGAAQVTPPREGTQRLAFFVRDAEVLVFLQYGSELSAHRIEVSRRWLLELRILLVGQLANGAEPEWIERTAAELSEVLLRPFLPMLHGDVALHIVADDVLAGMPFHVLPLGDGSDGRLLDAFVVSYGADLGRPRPFRLPQNLLAVGVWEAPPSLDPLPRAESEARGVQAMFREHGEAALLLTEDVSPATLLASMPGRDGLHVASHFRLHAQRPGASALVLGREEATQSLAVEDLLRAVEVDGLELLYLSGCDTGAGLAPSPHGVHSLAQLLAHPSIGTSVLSLWRLDDRVAGPLAEAFYRHLMAGDEPAAALRRAQLSLRGSDTTLRDTMALVVYN